MPSHKLNDFVVEMRRRLSGDISPELHPYRKFKFLLSLQGFKAFSFTSYDDLTQFEYPWFQTLGLGLSELHPAMLYKGYLKGIRRITRDIFAPNWLETIDSTSMAYYRRGSNGFAALPNTTTGLSRKDPISRRHSIAMT